MNVRALKLKNKEVTLEQRSTSLKLANIANRKTALERQISHIDKNSDVLNKLAGERPSTNQIKSLVRLLNYRAWCDGLLVQSEEHRKLLLARSNIEQSKLEQAIQHLKGLKDKQGVFENLLKRDLRARVGEIRAGEDSSNEELALVAFAKGLL